MLSYLRLGDESDNRVTADEGLHNIADIISLCGWGWGRGGGCVCLVSIVVRGRGVGPLLCSLTECSSKSEEECSCSAAAEESGPAVFSGRGHRSSFHVSVIIFDLIHPKRKKIITKKKRHTVVAW